MPPDVLHYQKRISNIIIGASTLRNQGARGVISEARRFLSELRLGRFVQDNESQFVAELNEQTEVLRRVFPANAQHWGSARKAINLFLAEAYHHRVLCETYHMDAVARWLEVPLDAQVARYLLEHAARDGVALPRWTRIRNLTGDASAEYQRYAATHAAGIDDGWLRVHLDLVAWRSEITERGRTNRSDVV